MVKDMAHYDVLARQDHYINNLHCGKVIWGAKHSIKILVDRVTVRCGDFATLVDMLELDDKFRELDNCVYDKA